MKIRGEGFTIERDDFEAWCASDTDKTFDEWLDAKLDREEAAAKAAAAARLIPRSAGKQVMPGDITYAEERRDPQSLPFWLESA